MEAPTNTITTATKISHWLAASGCDLPKLLKISRGRTNRAWRGPYGLLTVLLFALMFLCPAQTSPIWCPTHCSCYNDWTTVDCSSQWLDTIPPLPNSTSHLYLDNNHLEYLMDASFTSTPLLLMLNLHNNQLTVLESSSFFGLLLLQDLNLSNNEIVAFNIAKEMNGSLKTLTYLDLSYNQLRSIPRNLSYFAPNLEVLNLNHNLITVAMFDMSYSSMRRLNNLDLGHNLLHHIDTTHFNALQNIGLEILSMSECSLVYLDPSTFTGMNNLTSLTLDSNHLSADVLAAAFDSFPRNSTLSYLDLSGNPLAKLTPKLFSRFRSLTSLDVSNCDLDSVETGTFRQLSNLQRLYISNNRLPVLNDTEHLKELRRLNASRNRIFFISISYMENIEVLSLSHNQMEILPRAWMSGAQGVNHIDLSYNRLKRIDLLSFAQVECQVLDLSHNKLATFHSFGFKQLITINLSHNKIDFINKTAFDNLDMYLEELDLSSNQLSSLPNRTFPDLVALQRLDLSHNHLGSWFGTMPRCMMFSSFQHIQVLNLSYNNLTGLPQLLCNYLAHLTTLYLQGNLIATLKELGLSDLVALMRLDLSHNTIRTVDPAVLMRMGYLDSLDLSRNPFQCTCDLLPFVRWLNDTSVLIEGLKNPQNYLCTSPSALRGRPVTSQTPNPQTCIRHHNITNDLLFFGITVGVVAGLSLFLTLIFYYGKLCQRIKSLRYRWQIRYREVSGVEIDSKM